MMFLIAYFFGCEIIAVSQCFPPTSISFGVRMFESDFCVGKAYQKLSIRVIRVHQAKKQ